MSSDKKRKRSDTGASNDVNNVSSGIARAPGQAAVQAAFTVTLSPSPPPAGHKRVVKKTKQPKNRELRGEIADVARNRETSLAGPSQQQAMPRGSLPSPQPPPPQSAPTTNTRNTAAGGAVNNNKRTRKSKSVSKKRKTLTTKGRKNVVLNVLASVEAQRMSAQAQDAAGNTTQTAAQSTATGSGAQSLDPAATANLGKAWSKDDLATLARLAEDRNFLQECIPDHPAGSDLDWELISKYFGRYSKGGTAVKQQYYAVVRLMKEARREGKKGENYVELVKKALEELPNGGTVYEIQAILKRGYAKHLDKYRVKGQLRWKKAVGEVLREESSFFEAVSKTESGKIVWKLRRERND